MLRWVELGCCEDGLWCARMYRGNGWRHQNLKAALRVVPRSKTLSKS